MKPNDIMILNELRKNSRRSLTDIGHETATPLSTVFKKVIRLENSLIARYVSLINFTAIGYPFRTAAFITAKDKKKLSKILEKHPNVNTVLKLSDDQFYAELIFKDMVDQERFTDELKESKAAAQVNSHFIEDIKQEAFQIETGEEEEEECAHEVECLENGRIDEIVHEEKAILRFDIACSDCGKILGTEDHVYRYSHIQEYEEDEEERICGMVKSNNNPMLCEDCPHYDSKDDLCTFDEEEEEVEGKKKEYIVRFIQRVTIFEKQVKANTKKEAEKEAYQYMHKFDRNNYDEVETDEIAEEEEEIALTNNCEKCNTEIPEGSNLCLKCKKCPHNNAEELRIDLEEGEGLYRRLKCLDCNAQISEYYELVNTYNETTGEEEEEETGETEFKFAIKKEYRKEDYPTKEEAKEQFIADIAHNNFDIEEEMKEFDGSCPKCRSPDVDTDDQASDYRIGEYKKRCSKCGYEFWIEEKIFITGEEEEEELDYSDDESEEHECGYCGAEHATPREAEECC